MVCSQTGSGKTVCSLRFIQGDALKFLQKHEFGRRLPIFCLCSNCSLTVLAPSTDQFGRNALHDA